MASFVYRSILFTIWMCKHFLRSCWETLYISTMSFEAQEIGSYRMGDNISTITNPHQVRFFHFLRKLKKNHHKENKEIINILVSVYHHSLSSVFWSIYCSKYFWLNICFYVACVRFNLWFSKQKSHCPQKNNIKKWNVTLCL